MSKYEYVIWNEKKKLLKKACQKGSPGHLVEVKEAHRDRDSTGCKKKTWEWEVFNIHVGEQSDLKLTGPRQTMFIH